MSVVIEHPLLLQIRKFKEQYHDFYGNRERHFFVFDDGQDTDCIIMECNDGGGGNVAENINDRKVAQLLADFLEFVSK